MVGEYDPGLEGSNIKGDSYFVARTCLLIDIK